MNIHYRRITTQLSSSLVARGIGALSAVGLQIAVARLLGIEASGLLYTAITVALLFGILGRFGLDAALLRQASCAWHRGDHQAIASTYGQALSAMLISGGALGVGLLVCHGLLAELLSGPPGLAALLATLAITIPLHGITCLQSALLKASQRAGAAALLEVGLIPLCTMLLAVLLHRFMALTPGMFALAYALGTALTASIGSLLLALPIRSVLAAMRQPRWPVSGWTLTGIDLLNFALIAAALPIVAAVSNTAEAGLFNAAQRLAMQVGMIGIIVGSLLASRFAALHEAGATRQLAQARLARDGSRLMLVLATPALTLFLVWPEFALLLFGDSFAPMCTPLRILVLGQLFNMLTGPAGYLLVMTGHERELRNISVLTVGVSLPLTALLAAGHGANGAAAATSIGLILQNLGAARAVRQRLGINPWPWAAPQQPHIRFERSALI